MSVSSLQLDAIAAMASFSEPCTFLVAGGGTRSIRAIVDEDAQINVASEGMQSEERILITVLRDESNATYGGIAEPKIGSGIHLARDPAGKAYSYFGEKTQVNQYAHTLRFVRMVDIQIGGGLKQ